MKTTVNGEVNVSSIQGGESMQLCKTMFFELLKLKVQFLLLY